MMKRKGFTLIELLSVIVILAIIALIAIPVILSVISNSKERAFKQSLITAFHSYELYEADNKLKDKDTNEKIDITKLPTINANLNGEVYRNSDGEIELIDVTDGTYCAAGIKKEISLIKGTCEDLKNTLNLKLSVYRTSTSLDIIVKTILGAPIEYNYKIEGPDNYSKTKTSKTNIHTFDKLKIDTEYTITVTVKNNFGVEKILTETVKTLEAKAPIIELKDKDGKIVKDKFIKEGTIDITFPEIFGDNVIYEYKWEEDEDFTEVDDNIINVPAQNGTIIARVRIGDKVYDNSITITNVDNVPPEITTGKLETTENSITIPLNIIETNIDTITCKYSDKENTYDTDGVIENNTCKINNPDSEKDYYYKICVTDKAGNKKCFTDSTIILAIPDMQIRNTSTTSTVKTSNGYSREQTVDITFNGENIQNPTYYIKTTQVGTASIDTLEACGNGDMPGECASSNVKALQPNTWYRVSGDLSVVYNTETNENGTIYALVYNGRKFSEAATGTILKIDRTGPNIVFGTNGNNTISTTQSSTITVTNTARGATLDTSSYKYIWSTSKTATPNKSFTSGSRYSKSSGEGTYYLIAKACDILGNCTTTTSDKFKIDTIGPDIEIIEYSSTSSKMWVTIEASDYLSDIYEIQWRYDDGNWRSMDDDQDATCEYDDYDDRIYTCKDFFTRSGHTVYFKALDWLDNESDEISKKVVLNGSSGGSGSSSSSNSKEQGVTSSCPAPTCTLGSFNSQTDGLNASFSCSSSNGIKEVIYIYSEYRDLSFDKDWLTYSGNSRTSTWTISGSATQGIDPPEKGIRYYFLYGARTNCGSTKIYKTEDPRSF